jgi:endoglucanase
MKRRELLAITGKAVLGMVAMEGMAAPKRALPEATPEKLPRWRGFNLLEKFNVARNARFVEQDFEWIAAARDHCYPGYTKPCKP